MPVEQLFGWTPANPKVGQVGYVQLHRMDDGTYDFVVREHGATGPQTISSCPMSAEGLRGFQHAISIHLASVAGSASAEIHPSPVEFTNEEIEAEPDLVYFHYSHLPPHLQARSAMFAKLAREIMDTTPPSGQRTMGLFDLLRAKDCIVRAALVRK